MGFYNSSICRKVIMSISGLALVLFIIFHGSMNPVLIFSEKWQKHLKIIGSGVAATSILPFATVIIDYMCINIGMMI